MVEAPGPHVVRLAGRQLLDNHQVSPPPLPIAHRSHLIPRLKVNFASAVITAGLGGLAVRYLF